MRYVKLREAVKITGLPASTLRKYSDEGKIETIGTPDGHRLFNCESLFNQVPADKIVLYCRDSSAIVDLNVSGTSHE